MAGERATWVPSDRVTAATWAVGLGVVEVRAAASVPPSRMTTASPRTMRAGPRTDIGS